VNELDNRDRVSLRAYTELRAEDVVDSIGQKMHRCVDMKARLTYLKQFNGLQADTSNQGFVE